jgi:hypothetical protein
MIKKLKFLALVVLVVCYSGNSFSSPAEYIGFKEVNSGGLLSGCELDFVSNNSNSSDIFIGVFYYFSYDDNSSFPKECDGNCQELFKDLGGSYLLKLGVFNKKLEPNRINYAYFKTKNCSSVKKGDKVSKEIFNKIHGNNFDCYSSVGKEIERIDENNKFSMWHYLSDIPFSNIDKNVGEIEIGYNEKRGGIDSKIILDFNDEKNAQEAEDFSGCIKKLKRANTK